MLSKNQLYDVCALGQGDICRYLSHRPNISGYVCVKKHAARKKEVDDQINQLIKSGDLNPKDVPPINCDGYPILYNIIQGYDV